jgi:hypothetical protein
MADIDLKTLTPDTSLPKTGFLFGADSQATTDPSVYTTQSVATTLLGSTSLTGDTLTASAPVLDLAQTWNNAAVTFTGIKYNVTDTASAAASLLMDLQVGGATKFNVLKDGTATVASNGGLTSSGNLFIRSSAGASVLFFGTATNNSVFAMQTSVGAPSFNGRSTAQFGWTSGIDGNGTVDTFLTRRGTGNLRFGQADAASPLAQTLSVQSVVAGTSNTAGADWTLTGSQSTGSGAAGNLVLSTAFANTVGTATVTITIATPGVITWTAHGLVTGSPVVFTTTGALPTGITAGTTYFAITSSTLGVNTFQIATSAANAAAGTAVATSGTQSGVQTGTTSATVQSPLMTTTTFGPSGLTGSQTTPVLNLAQTWNTSGNATALKLNVTNTASGGSSLLMDLQVGGVSTFNAKKDGSFGSPSGFFVNTFGVVTGIAGCFVNNTETVRLLSTTSSQSLLLANGLGLSSNGSVSSNFSDVKLFADAANTLALRNGTAAQALNIYNTYTSSTSFERYSVDWITTANLAIVGPNKGSVGGTQRVQRLSYLEDGGAGSTVPLLGSTCPAASGTVKSWIKIITSDGTTAYIPCWA